MDLPSKSAKSARNSRFEDGLWLFAEAFDTPDLPPQLCQSSQLAEATEAQLPARMSSRAVVSTTPASIQQASTTEKNANDSAESALDFIGPSNAVKSLFTVPYTTDKGISVAVHNIDGTLLVDAVDEDFKPITRAGRRRRRPSTFDTPPPQETALALVSSMLDDVSLDEDASVESEERIQKETAAVTLRPGEAVADLTQRLPAPEQYSTIPLPAPPREYLEWKFHDLQLLVGSDALIYGDTSIHIADAKEMQSMLNHHEESVRAGNFVADHQLARMEQRGKPSYAQALDEKHKRHGNRTFEKASSFSAPDLDQVQLQTCIVPSSTTPLGGLLSEQSRPQALTSSAPVCTVMDAYLDNIIANVPQLALCLREKGFIQSVKLLETKDIPSSLMARSTLETTDAFSISKIDDTTAAGQPLFSPQIMEMNASTLLRFLKANCKRDNSTYLLRREAGHTNLQLYDISSISAQRQRKWIWWLATMSYRFALRLGQLNNTVNESSARRRSFRARQRSLLQNALNLLEDLADMDGSAHETLCAAVSENLADTFLCSDEQEDGTSFDSDRPATISSPPYAHITADALGKAQDHLTLGIKKLGPLLERTQQEVKEKKERRKERFKVSDANSSSSSEEDGEETTISMEVQSISLQLFSLHHKLINVSLRLAEHHLSNYWSSSAMQALRTAARTIADAISLLRLSELQEEKEHLQLSLRYQVTWLWEHCGHFARSFAADDLWRERGHTCGDDIISVLRDVESAVSVDTDRFNPNDWFNFALSDAPITDDTGGLVSLNEVGSIVEKEFCTTISEVQKATNVLDRQKPIQRDQRRVLVAACVSYSRAIGIFEDTLRIERKNDGECDGKVAHESGSNEFLSLLRQRLGDSCNEIGKILLRELRQLMTSSNEASVAEIMLHSAQFWFDEGLNAFESCHDLRNLALLRCNLCQCWKIRANASFATTEEVKEGSTHAEECLQIAANHLEKAHEALDERDMDPMTWDMVSQELAATFLVLGVRRRQTALGGGTTPSLIRLSPGQERGIVEPMEQALKIYEESGNAHQAAAANYQLALFYSRVWTCQRDEIKTREKLSSAFNHYAAAHAYFGRAPAGNESTFVLLCLDLANLYAAVSGKECLVKALLRCLDTIDCFSPSLVEAERADRAAWLEKMMTLALSVEDRIFKLLVSLVKSDKDVEDSVTMYKDLYRAALTSKMRAKKSVGDKDVRGTLATSHELLVEIKASHQQLMQTPALDSD